jgi:hypothetical protein
MAAIEDLDLAPVARRAAEQLLAAHPGVVFTSGRRDIAGQAQAMAANVVRNIAWIAQTYTDTPQRAALQAVVDALGHGYDARAYAAVLRAELSRWSDLDLAHVSKHLSGDAFDVQPVPGAAGELIKDTIRKLPGLTKFLDREGGLVRWHAQFA